jgi:Cft2 family RNA processing exonuclease
VRSYTEEDVDASMDRIEVVDFWQTIEVSGMQV